MKYKKIILHVPHSSLYVPAEFINDYIDMDEFQFTIDNLTDIYIDELFDYVKDGVEKHVFPYSRVFCDVERFIDDEMEPMSKKGMGVYYTKGLNGKRFRAKNKVTLSFINQLYENHHRAIKNSLRQSNQKFEKPLIIDCHSFSDKRFENDGALDGDSTFPDFCIGYNRQNGFNSNLVDKVTNILESLGYKVAHNYPYSGSLYYDGYEYDSIMIEVNKRLYLLDNKKRVDYYKIKYLINHIIKSLLK